ncbi:hypothetical protein KAR91_59230 [Candidatus Pacearchaeota archaeon]|nr:hypothetical protein [Candidatus Pacearchaeota archaeon]
MEKLKSRKFILVVATAMLTICNDGLGLGLPSESIMTIVGLVASYCVSQGYVDGKEKEASK